MHTRSATNLGHSTYCTYAWGIFSLVSPAQLSSSFFGGGGGGEEGEGANQMLFSVM